jgi:hypothetical protein
MTDLISTRFAPVEIGADISALPVSELQALAPLVDAARIMDALFLRQVWAGNETMLHTLARDSSADGRRRLHAFLLNQGPWSRLDDNAPLVPGAPAKPHGANFYPIGSTKDEIQRWLDALPAAARQEAAGFFTTIRRSRDGAFAAVPYSVEYQQELTEAARLLREAARLTVEPSLQRFLDARAAAFLSNDYYESDVAWMELDAPIEPTIGPYEVYEDELFNYKAAFEAFITIRDAAETTRLNAFSAHLQPLEDALPIDPKYRNPRVGSLTPIRVVNVIFTAGDANRGVQTAAFNLPNDERVLRQKGSKSVMLKNVQEAKFHVVLEPIAGLALTAHAQRDVSFDAFFTHILLHELLHGLGPHDIQVAGRTTTVRQELRETYSAVEEAKADVSGLWALQRLVDQRHVGAEIGRSMYSTFLASMFRSLRFGIAEAHGRGVAIQLNHFLDTGAVRVDADGRFEVVEATIRDAVTSLTREIMTLQAEGSYAKAKGLIERLGVVRPEVQRVLQRLDGIPVDIEPQFVTAAAISAAPAFPRSTGRDRGDR